MIQETHRCLAIGVVVTCACCASAHSQHIDILLWDDGGKVGVGEYDYDNLTASDRRVQTARFDEEYTIASPGFTAFEGADALPANTNVEWNFLPMAVDTGPHAGYRSTILYWDGTSEDPEFGPTVTGDYEFLISPLANLPAAATGTAEVESGSIVVTTDAAGEVHDHPFYFLDDNGDGLNDTLPAAGIYVVGLQLLVGALEPSDPVFMVWATPEFEVLPAIRPAALWVNERIDSLVIEPLPGDYNANGAVDAADYTVWRDAVGMTGDALSADGNGDEVIDHLDYEIWRSNYGTVAFAPSSAAVASRTQSIPEPHSFLLFLFLVIGAGGVPRRSVSLGAH